MFTDAFSCTLVNPRPDAFFFDILIGCLCFSVPCVTEDESGDIQRSCAVFVRIRFRDATAIGDDTTELSLSKVNGRFFSMSIMIKYESAANEKRECRWG